MNVSVEQLVSLAEKCGFRASIESGKAANPNANEGEKCVILHHNSAHWDPIKRDNQAFGLLQEVIKQGNCKLVFDDGTNEFFIYSYLDPYGPPLGLGTNLNETIVDAALELWDI